MAGRKILIVEDNEDHRWILVLWLQKLGACEIGEASMGQEALDCIRRTPPRANSAEGRRPSTGPEKRSAPRAGPRLRGAVASRGRPPARSLRDRPRP